MARTRTHFCHIELAKTGEVAPCPEGPDGSRGPRDGEAQRCSGRGRPDIASGDGRGRFVGHEYLLKKLP